MRVRWSRHRCSLFGSLSQHTEDRCGSCRLSIEWISLLSNLNLVNILIQEEIKENATRRIMSSWDQIPFCPLSQFNYSCLSNLPSQWSGTWWDKFIWNLILCRWKSDATPPQTNHSCSNCWCLRDLSVSEGQILADHRQRQHIVPDFCNR